MVINISKKWEEGSHPVQKWARTYQWVFEELENRISKDSQTLYQFNTCIVCHQKVGKATQNYFYKTAYPPYSLIKRRKRCITHGKHISHITRAETKNLNILMRRDNVQKPITHCKCLNWISEEIIKYFFMRVRTTTSQIKKIKIYSLNKTDVQESSFHARDR